MDRRDAKSLKRPAAKRASAKKKTAAQSKAKRPAKETGQGLSGKELRLVSDRLESMDAEARVRWALEAFPRHTVMSSSFGAQSAVCLHLVTRVRPRIPVILVDTGYLFPETYRFVDELRERLNLNLRIYRAAESPAWQEARHGKLWEQGVAGIEKYNLINKVEPMERALRELKARAWISGVRRDQSDTREKLDVLGFQDGVVRVHPIIDWNDREIYKYLKKFDLPYHPLWEDGYISIGDWHTSHRLVDAEAMGGPRFFGHKRECGLHENSQPVESAGDYVI